MTWSKSPRVIKLKSNVHFLNYDNCIFEWISSIFWQISELDLGTMTFPKICMLEIHSKNLCHDLKVDIWLEIVPYTLLSKLRKVWKGFFGAHLQRFLPYWNRASTHQYVTAEILRENFTLWANRVLWSGRLIFFLLRLLPEV